MKKMIFFNNMRLTTSTSSVDQECRCTFDASGKRGMSIMVDCVICGRCRMFSDTIKCDACHRFAHRRCVRGALHTGQRDGDFIVRAQVACGEDRNRACTDAVTQTSLATCDVGSGDEIIYVDGSTQASVATRHVASGDEIIYVDGSSQATVATRHVASGDDIIYVDGSSQATVATRHVASGDDIIYVDGSSQATVATRHVASGDEIIYVDGSSQATVATRHVASGDEIIYVDGSSQAMVATRHVSCGDQISHVDGSSQATVATCHVACGDETVYVDGCSQHSEATSCDVLGEVTVHVDDRPQVDVATGRDATEKLATDLSSEEDLPRAVPPTAVATVTPCARPVSRTETFSLTKAVDGQLVVSKPHPPPNPIGATTSFGHNQNLLRLRVRFMDIIVREFGPTIERVLFEAAAIRSVTPKAVNFLAITAPPVPSPSPSQITAFDFLKSVWGSLSVKQKELHVKTQRLKIAPAPFAIQSKLTRLDYLYMSKEWTYGRTRKNDINRRIYSTTIINSKFKGTDDK